MTTTINISSCFENPQSALTIAFRHRNIDAFKHALKVLGADPNKVDEKNGLTIFEHVLQTKNSSSFINACVDNGADMYAKNSQGKYPLHYAVDSYSPENLQTLLSNKYDLNKMNVLFGHRNALHLLMENLLNPDCEHVEECIKILVLNGCNVNMPNEKNRTPFFLLLKAQPKLQNKHDLVDFIMEECEVDLYTYKSKEMVEMFKKNNSHHQLPKQVDKVIDTAFMSSLLRANKESQFLEHFNVFKEIHTNKNKFPESDENKSNDFSEECSKLLYTAVENNLENVVEQLVLENVDVNKKPEHARRSAIDLACSHGNHRILKALFSKEPKLDDVDEQGKNLLHIATEHFGMDPSKNPKLNYEKCFYLALEKCNVNQQDHLGYTPLHYAARYRNDKAVIALLQNGSYIGLKSFKGESPIDEISYKALETYLNGCIFPNPRRHGDEEQEINIDYKFLIAPQKPSVEFQKEIEPLQDIANNNELRPLIRHPVLSSFLFLKWSKLSFLFHLNLLIFSIFMISLISYIVTCQSMTTEEKENSMRFTIVKMLSFIGVIILAIRELFQFVLSPFNYIKSSVNWFEIALVILGFILITKHDQEDNNETHLRIIRALTILLAAYEFLQLIGTLPYLSISTHMVILKKVAITFLKSLLLYSILLLSFAFCFFTLFGGRKEEKDDINKASSNTTSNAVEKNEKDNGDDDDVFNKFGYPGIAIIKTFVMLTGEFDASELALNDNGAYSIIFVLFVFLITIVLFNLLNALAIDDTQQIKAEGELVDLCERIRVLYKYESINLGRWWKKIISVFPYTIPKGKIVIHPNVNNEIMIYKMTSPKNDVESNGNGSLELQKMKSNYEQIQKLIPHKKTSDQLQKYTRGMDIKIMKKIRIVLKEKDEVNEHEDLNSRIDSLECEIKDLKSTIMNLCKLIERQ